MGHKYPSGGGSRLCLGNQKGGALHPTLKKVVQATIKILGTKVVGIDYLGNSLLTLWADKFVVYSS